MNLGGRSYVKRDCGRKKVEKYCARVVKGDDLRSPAELRVGSNPTGTTFLPVAQKFPWHSLQNKSHK